MKTGVRILNFARGDLAVPADVLKALEEGGSLCAAAGDKKPEGGEKEGKGRGK